ncbi:tRNA-queuosine alpha-mannosyltransferase domain-containing protein [Marinomonas pollencensis]|uniref:tRNA-queuosine alpha-mannosyltransferase n=1 Tax=Marinomonas pollencensis TaxID=491954 RepID=A0A3E0DMH9_9GAMM|nr:DUF3524 domain-containing protein [Marinomonas pollencensis]REG83322.1 glycosyl transferase family 1 [Marinomonas pollencensis]
MRILLISAYEASSHKAWANSLMSQLAEHDWSYMALPARHFAWRIRGNAMSFAFDPKFKTLLEKPYDLIIATSMTDCVGLKAFCPDLQNIPWFVYFHENQFAYPASAQQQGLVEMQMVTLYSALAADQCIFNSQFNKDSFFSGARALLTKLPDYVSPDWLNVTEEKAKVLAVPISQLRAEPSRQKRQAGGPVRLVWSARWEYDKGPDRLLAILQELKRRHVPFEIAILGEQFRTIPKEFEQIKQDFSEYIHQFGYAQNRQDYLNCLATADMVLSTALHEFQGLAVLEAVSLGCVPVLPNRQVYPELFGDQYLYHSHNANIQLEAKSAVDLIIKINLENTPAPSTKQFQTKCLLPEYRRLISAMS